MTAPKRPMIGICAVRERARWAFWDQPAHLVADSYVAPLQRAGGLAVLLAVDTRAPLELLPRIDGLMLIGGADIDPAAYGVSREPATESTYPERDGCEISLLRGAIERGMPVLGICRGMQILNVALGGTLEQHITDRPGLLVHGDPSRGPGGGVPHEVSIEPGTLLAEALGTTRCTVRSHHHQAVDELAPKATATAWSDDGVLEGFELDEGWVVAVQWHPEMSAAEDPVQQRLFDTFVRAC